MAQYPIPADSLIADALERIDYADNFGEITSAPIQLEQLPILFFQVFPSWFTALMGLREVIARWIGLKTAHGMDVHQQIRGFKGEVGESIALFHVLGRNEHEILFGEDDAHLNFRLSFIKEMRGDQTCIQLATTVQYTGWMGRVYFFFVRPIHRLAVPLILKRMIRRLEKLDQAPSFQPKPDSL